MDVNGYLDLIPTENSRKPKFMRFVEAIITPGLHLQSAIQNYGAFDVNNAVGKQLDILGEYIGISRELNYVPPSGETVLGDTDFSMLVRMRVAQEAWSGSNDEVMDIYSIAAGNDLNIYYEDNLDCSINVEADVTQTSMLLALNANKEFLQPAGVHVNLVLNDSMITDHEYNGLAITGISYSDKMELITGGE